MKTLIVGEKLIADSRYHGLSMVTVERLTNKSAVLSDGSKLDNPTYDHVRAKGDTNTYATTYYRFVTEDLLNQYKRQNALRKITKVKWEDLSTDKINQVLDLIIL